MFAVGCIAALTINAVPMLRQAAEQNEIVVGVLLNLFLLVNVFLVFGFLSRRCERQADVFGCRAVSCAQPHCFEHTSMTELAPAGTGLCRTGIGTFIEALEKVAVLNGICRSRPGWMQSWRHSTIARRVEFLHELRFDPRADATFQRKVGRVKWALVAGLALILMVLAAIQWWSHLPDMWHVVARTMTRTES
jgi:STE24 endopeptidase